jgi:xanthine/CO dehydrogenase XdhC/CoxF family maturation factor
LLGTHEAETLAGKPSVNVSAFQDRVAPPVRLLVFGAGHDAQPLAQLAKELGWHVNVFDPRPALATAARFPTADAVTIAPPEAAASIPLDAWTLAVVMTHRYAFDVPLIQALLPRPLPYLGLLGPKKRTEKILADLIAAGLTITDEMRARLHGPVGLDLGGDTPESVALAVLAEIQSTLAGRDARPLRERTGPIHG